MATTEYDNFINVVCGSPRGQIVAINAIRGAEGPEPLHDAQAAQRLFRPAYDAILPETHAGNLEEEFFQSLTVLDYPAPLHPVKEDSESALDDSMAVVWPLLPPYDDLGAVFQWREELSKKPNVDAREWAKRISSLPETERWVELKDAQAFGRERKWVWFTLRSEIEHILSLPLEERANRCRDLLGLIHRKKDECLIAYFLPFSALPHLCCAQPTFKEGATYSRFLVHCPPHGDGYGRAVDIGALRDDPTKIRRGARERIMPPFKKGDMLDSKIHFEIIGFVTSDSAVDEKLDDEFISAIREPHHTGDFLSDFIRG